MGQWGSGPWQTPGLLLHSIPGTTRRSTHGTEGVVVGVSAGYLRGQGSWWCIQWLWSQGSYTLIIRYDDFLACHQISAMKTCWVIFASLLLSRLSLFSGDIQTAYLKPPFSWRNCKKNISPVLVLRTTIGSSGSSTAPPHTQWDSHCCVKCTSCVHCSGPVGHHRKGNIHIYVNLGKGF